MHPVIETERLLLRPPQLGDEKPLNEAINRSLPALQRWMPWAVDPSFEPSMRFVKEGIASWSNEQAKDFPIYGVSFIIRYTMSYDFIFPTMMTHSNCTLTAP